MKWLIKLILQILANALAIFLLAKYVPQIKFTGDLLDYLLVGLILSLANLIVRPILRIISAPLIFITMGLFMIVINAIILFGVDWFVQELTIIGFWGYFWGVIVISILNAAVHLGTKKHE